ncbi:neurotensin/neuromedin N-like [Arapaima gigas]
MCGGSAVTCKWLRFHRSLCSSVTARKTGENISQGSHGDTRQPSWSGGCRLSLASPGCESQSCQKVLNPGCPDAEQERKTAEDEFLSSIFTSKVSEQGAPFWRGTLRSVCGLLSGWKAPLLGGDGALGAAERGTPLSRTLQEIGALQDLCRMLLPWELVPNGPEFPDADQTDGAAPPKRKSPYILKRQLRASKARRPYILKRFAGY